MKIKGSELLIEKPFVYVLSSQLRNSHCDNCLAGKDTEENELELKKCTGCSYVHYCNKDCQKQSWLVHKKECRNIKKILPKVLPDSARLLARIIIKLKFYDGDNEQSYYTQHRYRKFENLMSHYNEIAKDTNRVEHLHVLVEVLKIFLSPDILEGYNVIELFGKMVINSFNILDINMNSVGTGIYLGASTIDHSCSPTAVAVFNGPVIHIRNIKDIYSYSWSDVTISYIDVLNFSHDRRKDLQSQYYFLCDCVNCIDNDRNYLMRSMECPNTKCKNAVLVKENMEVMTCSKCETIIDAEHFEAYHRVVEILEYHIQHMTNRDIVFIDACKMCLEKQKGVLHNMNLNRVKILELAFDCCIDMEMWDDAVVYGTEALPGLKTYYGDYHPMLGLAYLKLGKIHMYKENIEEARRLLFDAENIINVTHGRTHPLYDVLRNLIEDSRC